MRHPSETELELYTCQDLGLLAAWKTALHVQTCGQCSEKVAQLREFWKNLDWSEDLPEPEWNHLAAEIKANIHLGLSAAECVRPRRVAIPARPSRVPLAIAFASLLVVAAAGTFWHPRTPPGSAGGEVLETSGAGLEEREGQQVLQFVHRADQTPIRTVSAAGEVRSRYMDGNDGGVTIVNVYAQ